MTMATTTSMMATGVQAGHSCFFEELVVVVVAPRIDFVRVAIPVCLLLEADQNLRNLRLSSMTLRPLSTCHLVSIVVVRTPVGYLDQRRDTFERNHFFKHQDSRPCHHHVFCREEHIKQNYWKIWSNILKLQKRKESTQNSIYKRNIS